MIASNRLTTSIAGGALLCFPAFSQDEVGPRSEVSVQVLGAFVKATTHDGIRVRTFKSGGVLGTYRWFFSKHLGIEANYAFSRSTQDYDSFGFGMTRINGNQHEITGAYVLRFPTRRITPFIETGVGALVS